jgi:hypothetical protein
MDTKEFRENLLIYGADINRWPDGVRQEGIKLLESSPEHRTLQEDHGYFEKMLRSRRYEESADNFAQRIISASLQQRQKPRIGPVSFWEELVAEFRISRPALAALSFVMVLILTIGLAAGFVMYPAGAPVLNNAEETGLQAFLFDEGDTI